MQFDKFDDKVKQAAEQHHPNYDEQAWTKMEKLLDRHLPQNNNRRRRVIFFLLFALLMGAGLWLIADNPWQHEKTISSYQNKDNTPGKTVNHSSAVTSEKQNETSVPVDVTKKQTDGSQQSEIIIDPANEKGLATNREKISSPLTSDNKLSNNNHKTGDRKKPVPVSSLEISVESGTTTKINNPANRTTKQDEVQNTNNSSVVTTTSPSVTDNRNDETQSGDDKKNPVIMNENKDNKVNEQTKPATNNETAQQPPAVTDEKKITKKNPGKKGNTFFVSVSAGPDISSVGLDKPGKVKIMGGAGFGYTFNNKWTIRTGFYTARKIYSADKESYKPAVVMPNYTYLSAINADCKVYEIPLSLAYNFAQAKKGNWFASAGLSSYIMKKEVYDYVYTYPGGTIYTYTKTIDNENKNYFSVLSLSAGYQRKISKNLSISAEPYVRAPLSGIGFGNVKLNSAGVLFSLSLDLFQSASKK